MMQGEDWGQRGHAHPARATPRQIYPDRPPHLHPPPPGPRACRRRGLAATRSGPPCVPPRPPRVPSAGACSRRADIGYVLCQWLQDDELRARLEQDVANGRRVGDDMADATLSASSATRAEVGRVSTACPLACHSARWVPLAICTVRHRVDVAMRRQRTGKARSGHVLSPDEHDCPVATDPLGGRAVCRVGQCAPIAPTPGKAARPCGGRCTRASRWRLFGRPWLS